jgi:hypothetical protein
MLAGGYSIIFEAPTSLFTDEYRYMPHALDDILHLRNPYSTQHSEDVRIKTMTGSFQYNWRTTDPYLPLIAIFQIPFIDYRWTSLLAYASLLWRLRKKPAQFFGFANPFVFPLAASGFNDFVVLALLAWGEVGGNSIFELLACGCKQFALPIVVVYHAFRREWWKIARACAFTTAIILPFIALNPQSFWYSVVVQHFVGENAKIPEFFSYYNYGLYVIYAVLVVIPFRFSKSSKS